MAEPESSRDITSKPATVHSPNLLEPESQSQNPSLRYILLSFILFSMAIVHETSRYLFWDLKQQINGSTLYRQYEGIF
jgi:hypothetical protein